MEQLMELLMQIGGGLKSGAASSWSWIGKTAEERVNNLDALSKMFAGMSKTSQGMENTVEDRLTEHMMQIFQKQGNAPQVDMPQADPMSALRRLGY